MLPAAPPFRRRVFARQYFLGRAVLAVFSFFSFLLASAAPAAPGTGDWLATATNHLGQWIWDTNTFDKQTCRLWRAFEIPAGGKILRATLRLTVDNGFTLFLDGQEIGRGSDWRTVTEYDVTQLLASGRHILGVEAFNDRLAGGLVFGMNIELADQPAIEIRSDDTWRVVPEGTPDWMSRKTAAGSHPAVVLGAIHSHPWESWPMGLATVSPLRPAGGHFWQRGWFQLSLLAACVLAVMFCLWLLAQLSAQAQTQKCLQVERVRIARDIHDDLGAQLTQLLLLGEVARREQPEDSAAQRQFTQLCDHARELAQALDEVVWAVNARRDTVRDFTSYVCKYAQFFLNATRLRCRLDVAPEIPATAFDLPVRRNLFLAVKEALNNAAKHSGADELFLRIGRRGQRLCVAVEDNGCGFAAAQTGGERNGLTNMAQRMAEIGGACEIVSRPGGGCRVTFTVPLPRPARRWFHRAPQNPAAARATEINRA